MDRDLKKIYYTLLFPAVFGHIVFSLAQNFGVVYSLPERAVAAAGPLVFTLSAIFSVALPIFYRAVFANRMRHSRYTPLDLWLKFERNLLCIAMVAPYLSLAAIALRLPGFHFTGTVLMALYAVYYYFPSEKRLSFDRRIFRVK